MKFKKIGVFLACITIAIGGIIYELIIASAATYLLGNSVLQFSLTIGIYLFGMGIGSYLIRFIKKRSVETFILVEVLLSLIGGLSGASLYFIFGYAPKIFLVFFIFLVLVIGILIGFEIPMLVKILDEENEDGKSLSNVLTLDYIGSLLASLLFPFILLPYLGVIKSALIIGLLNLLISILIFFFFYKNSAFKKLFILFQSFSLLLLASFLIFSVSISNSLEHKLFTDEVVFSKQSLYQKIVVTRYKDDTRLFLDRNLQFSSKDEYRYHETLVHSLLSGLPNAEKILVLGGGDGLAVREILKDERVKEITLIDIDFEITNLAKENPLFTDLNKNALKDPKVKVINQDALIYLRENTNLFQGIIIDFPDPNNETLAKLYTKEFYELVKRNLSADGAFISQSTSTFFTKKTFWTINSTIGSVFTTTIPLHVNVPSFGEWGFIIGSNYKLNFNEKYFENKRNKFLDSNTFKTALIFPQDLIFETEEINTNQNLKLMFIYDEEVKSFKGN